MLYVLLVLAAWPLYMTALAVYSWQRPELGPVRGTLQPCTAKPNCVCSQNSPADRTVDALPIGAATPAVAFDRARDCVESLPRVALITASPGYARYECCTQLFRFADDIELLLDEPAGVIHIRSASRVGYSDMGVNRKRVEAIRSLYKRGM
ncbi:MAG: DUF1499 domain-containing protein [Planctomycetaceae bacterium]|nr:DUF1499 domain-containing protein [Planctomycetaceae bacterium]